jgi:hypothetical protein
MVTQIGVPEADQEVGAGTHALPAEEGHDQVVAHDQEQHRGDEQVEVDEELGVVRIALHVTDRVEVDERGDAGDEQRHRDAERIGDEPEVDRETAGRDPLEERQLEGALFCRQALECREGGGRGRKGTPHHGGGEPTRQWVAEAAPESQQQREADQWQGRDEPDEVFHLSPSSGRCHPRWRPDAAA